MKFLFCWLITFLLGYCKIFLLLFYTSLYPSNFKHTHIVKYFNYIFLPLRTWQSSSRVLYLITSIFNFSFLSFPLSCLFIHLSIYPSVYLSIHISICLSIYTYIHLFIYLSIYPSVMSVKLLIGLVTVFFLLLKRKVFNIWRGNIIMEKKMIILSRVEPVIWPTPDIRQ